MRGILYLTAMGLVAFWLIGIFYFSAGLAIHVLPFIAVAVAVTGMLSNNLWQMRHLFNDLFTPDNQYNH